MSWIIKFKILKNRNKLLNKKKYNYKKIMNILIIKINLILQKIKDYYKLSIIIIRKFKI